MNMEERLNLIILSVDGAAKIHAQECLLDYYWDQIRYHKLAYEYAQHMSGISVKGVGFWRAKEEFHKKQWDSFRVKVAR